MGKKVLKRTGGPCVRVYGQTPTALPMYQLPLWKDVDLAVEDAKDNKDLSEAEAVKKVTNDIVTIYKRASIGTIHPKKIYQKVKRVIQLRTNMMKNMAVDKRTEKIRDHGKWKQTRKNDLKNKIKLTDVMDKLFEVKKELEVDDIEKEFYQDQLGERKMYIGPLDQIVTNDNVKQFEKEMESLEKKNKRKDEQAKREQKEKIRAEKTKEKVSIEGEVRCDEEERCDNDSTEKEEKTGDDVDEHLPELLEIVEWFDISETAASHVYNLFSKKRKLNQSQIHKKKKKLRLKCVSEYKKEDVIAIGFDERKDDTKVVAGVGKAGSKRFEYKKEEHCAVVLWPGEEYAGHVVPRGGTAKELATDIHEFLEERRNIETENLKALISDGCEKMLWWKCGVHAMFENLRKKTYQRIVCFFHHLELSFGKVIKLYVVYTVSPDRFLDPWGQFLGGDVHKLPLVDFLVLPHLSLLTLIDSISPKTLKDLNTDHRTFIGILRIIITGDVDMQFVNMKIGPLVHSRFTTTETRFLRHWLSSPDPTFEQIRITRYLVYVWAETFLTAKRKNKMEDGSRLLLLELLLTKKYSTNQEYIVIKASLNFNGQFAHHESILVSLLTSPMAVERKLGVDTVFMIREQGPKVWKTPSIQRPFKKQDHILNGSAKSIATLNVNPLSAATTEPPLTRHLSGPQLLALLDTPLQVNLPVMSVVVERAVKEVTRTSKKNSNSMERDGIVFQTVSARAKNPYNNRNRVNGGN